MRELFRVADEMAPSIVFIGEHRADDLGAVDWGTQILWAVWAAFIGEHRDIGQMTGCHEDAQGRREGCGTRGSVISNWEREENISCRHAFASANLDPPQEGGVIIGAT